MNKEDLLKNKFENRAFNVFILIGFIIAITSAGCLQSNSMEFNFYVEETGENLNGNVYIDDKFLGTTENGILNAPKDELYPGEISLKGNYEGDSFVFYYDFFESDFEYNAIDFTVPESRLADISYSAEDVITDSAEDSIFQLINEERKYLDITPLERSEILDDIAESRSKDMVQRGYFSHTTPDGYGVGDILKENEIFYFSATENLMYLPVNRTTDIADETVQGWIESPGHRIPVLDTDKPILWDHVGIGVVATDESVDDGKETACYITAVFASFDSTYEDTLPNGYTQYYNIYDKSLGLEFDTNVNIKLQSSDDVDFYIVSDEEKYDDFLNRQNIQSSSVISKNDIQYFDREIEIEPGYGAIIDASESYKDVEYELSMVYNPE
ncbi:CAP domain-containing protein [Methanohalophilus mahii]|uniref:CAP domain-containing protein n=1 Tax=Methanohalophilus mahii TaxID=2176 RepID=UPI0006647CCF|nr:CAP domain-containing protein [Methanohalophilus mahii]